MDRTRSDGTIRPRHFWLTRFHHRVVLVIENLVAVCFEHISLFALLRPPCRKPIRGLLGHRPGRRCPATAAAATAAAAAAAA